MSRDYERYEPDDEDDDGISSGVIVWGLIAVACLTVGLVVWLASR